MNAAATDQKVWPASSENAPEVKTGWSELPVEFLTGIDDAAKLPAVPGSSDHKPRQIE
jgi:hypothetical protein